MKKSMGKLVLVATAMMLSGGSMSFAQQHEHPQSVNPSATPALAQAASQSASKEDIFCSTMKTGQLCSHGTAAILGLKGEAADSWIVLARKYNKAVDAATLQLFKDAEASLTPKQVELLKAWFAVGLNPQINELLYGKGLGLQNPAPAAPAPATGTTKD